MVITASVPGYLRNPRFVKACIVVYRSPQTRTESVFKAMLCLQSTERSTTASMSLESLTKARPTDMQYLFRAPVFPVIFKPGPVAVCAETPSDLDLYVQRHASKMPDSCELIDYTWEGWILYTKESLLAPSIAARRYTKRNLLLLCGVSEQQLSITNLNRYSREEVFDFLVQQAKQTA